MVIYVIDHGLSGVTQIQFLFWKLTNIAKTGMVWRMCHHLTILFKRAQNTILLSIQTSTKLFEMNQIKWKELYNDFNPNVTKRGYYYKVVWIYFLQDNTMRLDNQQTFKHHNRRGIIEIFIHFCKKFHMFFTLSWKKPYFRLFHSFLWKHLQFFKANKMFHISINILH